MRSAAVFLSIIILSVSMLSCMSPAQQKVEQGNGYFAKGQWNEAIALYEQALKDDPKVAVNNLADAYAGRAGAFLQSGDIDKAIADSNKFVELNKDAGKKAGLAQACYDAGNRLAADKKYEQAIKAFSAAVQYGLKNEQVYCALGDALSGKGEYHASISDYNAALDINPSSVKALTGRAYACFKDGDYNTALTDLSNVIDKDRNNLKALFNRGLVNKALGRFDKAVKDFTDAITVDKNFTEAYWARARTYYVKKDYENALADLNSVSDLKPSTAWAVLNDRAVIQCMLGNMQQAVDDLDIAIRQKPEYRICYFNRGIVFSRMNKPVDSLSDINRYLYFDAMDKFGCKMLAEDWRQCIKVVILMNPAIDTSGLIDSMRDVPPLVEYKCLNDFDRVPLYFDEVPGCAQRTSL